MPSLLALTELPEWLLQALMVLCLVLWALVLINVGRHIERRAQRCACERRAQERDLQYRVRWHQARMAPLVRAAGQGGLDTADVDAWALEARRA